MTSRILPPEEWPRLPDGATVWPLMDPARGQILVVEEDGAIVGTLTLLQVTHAECLWIAPSHRRRFGVMKRLLDGMWTVARALPVRAIWSGALSDTMRDILTRIGGVPVPGDSYVFAVKESKCHQ